MHEDRLRRDSDDVENLEDIIDARDADAAESDIELPEDIDVDDALTFPHPKHKKDPNEGIDLMDTPRKGDVEVDWQASQTDMLPSDYMDNYDEAVSTDVRDDNDEGVEDEIEDFGEMTTEDIIYNTPVVPKTEKRFHPEDHTPREIDDWD